MFFFALDEEEAIVSFALDEEEAIVSLSLDEVSSAVDEEVNESVVSSGDELLLFTAPCGLRDDNGNPCRLVGFHIHHTIN